MKRKQANKKNTWGGARPAPAGSRGAQPHKATLRIGQHIKIAYIDSEFEGEITRITRSADVARNVTVDLDNDGGLVYIYLDDAE